MSIDVPDLRRRLKSPSVDISELNDRLGRAWGVSCGESIPQYLAWCDAAGIFRAFAEHEPLRAEDLRARTTLGDDGIDALLPILLSIGVLFRHDDGRYAMCAVGHEYLSAESPYYVGAGLYWDCDKPIPDAYLKGPRTGDAGRSASRWPRDLRLKIPHSRNFGPSVVAARSGEFERVQHLVDLGGGSGAFAIPLALDHPRMRITLVELPDVVEGVRERLAAYGVERQVSVLGLDLFNEEWAFGPCDAAFFGNVFHAADDQGCRLLARKSRHVLSLGGRIWLHEVVFNAAKDGPLLAALWNANVIARTPRARQRTASELISILESAGFEHCYSSITAGHFALVTGQTGKTVS